MSGMTLCGCSRQLLLHLTHMDAGNAEDCMEQSPPCSRRQPVEREVSLTSQEQESDKSLKHYDVIIVGAGAAGLMCAIEAGRRGRRVLVIDHADRAGKKILISGGGRCNFTNLQTEPANYICNNSRFAISALSRYTPYDFLALVEKHSIAWEERDHGELFCVESARQIVTMLLAECESAGVSLQLNCAIQEVSKHNQFQLETGRGVFTADSLVIASGSRSIPKMGATGFGHQIADQFGLSVTELKPGLVPFRLTGGEQEHLKALAGISLDVSISCNGHAFREQMLFTHRGISGPAVLQISSYWGEGESISIDLLPGVDVLSWLIRMRQERPGAALRTVLAERLPKRLIQYLCKSLISDEVLRRLSNPEMEAVAERLHNWQLKPA
ncbi:MAG: aminoacetone oxidase family FAD-binding enzyme, partial [Mariprofundaceae bacterium]|nr:aminoacetone oxidase family FAD-binding enzyme [Mariprofundaceae bacterium]